MFKKCLFIVILFLYINHSVIFAETEEDLDLTKLYNQVNELNSSPILTANNFTINKNEKINIMEGVSAVDKEDGDITYKITSEGNVYNKIPGRYDIIYQVIDNDDNKTKKRITITVKDIPNNPPVIEAHDIILNINEYYNPNNNVYAYDAEDDNISNRIKVKYNNVNVKKLGTYKVIYQVKDNDNYIMYKNISVKVVRNKNKYPLPYLNINDIQIKQGESFYVLNKAEAYDYDGKSIFNKVKVKGLVDINIPNKYPLVVSLKSKNGNEVSKTIFIKVGFRNNHLPRLFAKNQLVNLNSTFDYEKYVKAVDIESGNLTKYVELYGFVDTKKIGNYPLIYKVTDKQNAFMTKTVIIKVRDNSKVFSKSEQPNIKYINNQLKIKDSIIEKENNDFKKYKSDNENIKKLIEIMTLIK